MHPVGTATYLLNKMNAFDFRILVKLLKVVLVSYGDLGKLLTFCVSNSSWENLRMTITSRAGWILDCLRSVSRPTGSHGDGAFQKLHSEDPR